MDQQTAQLILVSITAVAIVAWLCGLQFLLIARRVGRTGQKSPDLLGEGAEPPGNVILGSVEVDGRPGELAAKVAALLARQGMFKILERTDERVVFQGMGGIGMTNQGLGGYGGGNLAGGGWRGVRAGQIRLMPAGPQRTRVDYAIEMSGLQWLLWLGGLCQALGLAAIIIGFWLIQTYAVPNPNPGVRGQVVQMVQTVHFLWPPFLFGGIYRSLFTAARNGFDTMIHNLPHIGE